jgi:uncharacterized protein (DUF697 family)
MAKKTDEAPVPEAPLKVKRQRRRIYEEPAPEPAAQAEASAAPAQASESQAVKPQPAEAQAEPAPALPPMVTAQPAAAASPITEAAARAVIRHHMLAAMGIGLAPLPLVDTLAVSAVQLLLVRKLALRHGVAFAPGRARGLIASLLGGAGAVSIATGFWFSWVKAVPVVGASVGAATMPVMAGASTWALGMVFLRHFQAGGTLADFNPLRQGKAFAARFTEGRREAAGVPKPSSASTP